MSRLSYPSAVNFLKRKESKPWDNDELDGLKFLKFVSFVICMVAYTGVYILTSDFKNPVIF